MLKLRRSRPAVVIEQRNIQISGEEISYTLKRSGYRRSISLRIDDRGLTVNVPIRASEKWLHSVLQEKADWVRSKLEGWQSKKVPLIFWAEGARIPFRGEEFVLTLTPKLKGSTPQLKGQCLYVPVGVESESPYIEKIVTSWYRNEALRVFTECVEHFAPLMNVSPSEIKLSAARTQWGSCTVLGVVRLNWQLVKMPLHLIDYVVVHELAHLVEMNHSPAFWSVVEGVCPGYKQCRAELRDHGVPE